MLAANLPQLWRISYEVRCPRNVNLLAQCPGSKVDNTVPPPPAKSPYGIPVYHMMPSKNDTPLGFTNTNSFRFSACWTGSNCCEYRSAKMVWRVGISLHRSVIDHLPRYRAWPCVDVEMVILWWQPMSATEPVFHRWWAISQIWGVWKSNEKQVYMLLLVGPRHYVGYPLDQFVQHAMRCR